MAPESTSPSKGLPVLRRAFSIGSIAGIRLRVHWSWVAVMLLVIAALNQLYAGAAGERGAWPLAITAGLLLFVSVLLHELGHALVARTYGMTVGGITLFALGGATEIVETGSDPIRDLLIAVVGPLVSLLLAFVGGLAWWHAEPGPLALLAMHLALTNAAMAIFNLMPGFPLDGGRVLWAAASFLTGDEIAAARATSLVGRAFGWMLIAGGGLYCFAATDLLGGGWLVLSGLFLARNGSLGYRRLVVQRTLSGVSVADVMQRAYRAVGPELPLDQFVGRYVLGQIDQGFPVLPQPDADHPQPLLGMMTVRDLRRFQLKEWSLTRVGEAMTPAYRLRALPPEMSAGEALRMLIESGQEQLPVIEGTTLIGLLRRRDLLGFIERRAKRH